MDILFLQKQLRNELPTSCTDGTVLPSINSYLTNI